MSIEYRAFYNDIADWIYQQQEKAQSLGFGSPQYIDWIIASSGEICDKYYNDNFALKQMSFLWEHIDGAIQKNNKGVTIRERVKKGNQNISK